MKKYYSNVRLTLFSFLSICVYLYMIGYSFGESIADFRLGFNLGAEHAKMDKQAPEKRSYREVHFLSFKPTKGYMSFPDSIKNTLDGTYVHYRSQEIKVLTKIEGTGSQNTILYTIIKIITSFISTFFIIYLPILFIKTMISLMNEHIFDKKNIRRIRKMGISLIALYLFYFVFSWSSFKVEQSLFRFEDYELVFSPDSDMLWVLLGVVVLLFAEILARGYQLKEEQDLTI